MVAFVRAAGPPYTRSFRRFSSVHCGFARFLSPSTQILTPTPGTLHTRGWATTIWLDQAYIWQLSASFGWIRQYVLHRVAAFEQNLADWVLRAVLRGARQCSRLWPYWAVALGKAPGGAERDLGRAVLVPRVRLLHAFSCGFSCSYESRLDPAKVFLLRPSLGLSEGSVVWGRCSSTAQEHNPVFLLCGDIYSRRFETYMSKLLEDPT